MWSLLSRRVSRLVGVGLLLTLWPAASSHLAARTDTDEVSGVVRDAIGNLLEDVEILVVGAGDSVKPLAVAKSDARGRFRFTELPRGKHRVAALKEGYLTFIGKIDTQVQSWIQVVLHPAPQAVGASGAPVPDSASWVYRLPRRYILDSKDPQPATDEGAEEQVRTGSAGDPLQMQVDQLFSVGGSLEGDDETRPEVSGSETSLYLTSAIGDRGNIDVRGFHETLSSSRQSQDEMASANRDAAAVNLAFSYDTSPDAQVDVTAFYSEQATEYANGQNTLDVVAATLQSFRKAHRHWGYDARWSKQLGQASRLAVQLDYQDTSFRAPEPRRRSSSLENAPDEMFTRAVGATGSYSSEPRANHSLQIDFRAQLLDATEPVARIVELEGVDTVEEVEEIEPAGLAPGYFALTGLSVSLDARDTWSVAGPFAVVYGLGYKHALAPRNTSLFVPRLGGKLALGRGLSVSVLFSYHGVTDWTGSEFLDERPAFQPAKALGYDAAVDLALAGGIRLSGAARYSPIQFGLVGYSGGDLHGNRSPVYLTDGNAAVHENRLALVRDWSRTQTYFEVSAGDVEGMIAAITPYDVPDGLLASRSLRYRTGRVGVRVLASGTDVLVQYQRLVQAAKDDTSGARSAQNSMEVRVMQDLLRLRTNGYWRFLMAIRRATLESEGLHEILQPRGGELIGSLSHQVSAGLSVTF